MAANDPVSFPVNEQTSGQYTATLVANDGVTPLPGGTLTTLTLSLYVIKADGTQQVVNSRNVQNVLNLNNVTISAGGALAWAVQPGDTTLVETLAFERHIAIFKWTWPAGQGEHEVVLVVRHLLRTA